MHMGQVTVCGRAKTEASAHIVPWNDDLNFVCISACYVQLPGNDAP